MRLTRAMRDLNNKMRVAQNLHWHHEDGSKDEASLKASVLLANPSIHVITVEDQPIFADGEVAAKRVDKIVGKTGQAAAVKLLRRCPTRGTHEIWLVGTKVHP